MLVQFRRNFEHILYKKRKEIEALKNAYEMLNPKKRQKDGFVEIAKNGKKVKLENLKVNDIFDVVNADIKIQSKALKITKNDDL